MSARHKLNGAYFVGALLTAAALGWLFQSWWVFGIAALVLIVASLIAGDIRPTSG